jgi:hypothetical protein
VLTTGTGLVVAMRQATTSSRMAVIA